MSDKKTDTTPEPKREKTTAEAVAEAVKEALPAAILALEAARHATAPKQPERYRQNNRCNSCGQQVQVCKDKHTELVVAPRTYVPWPQFNPGVRINGVRYISTHDRPVVVPTVMVDQILGDMERWAENERIVAQGRKKTHQSGSIGPRGSGFVPANEGWR